MGRGNRMSMRSISIEEVAGIIRAQLGDKLAAEVALGPDVALKDLGLSSLDVTEVFVAVEEVVDRELDSVPVADPKTLAELVAVVNEQLVVGQETTTTSTTTATACGSTRR
jgi:acyl carrier protein